MTKVVVTGMAGRMGRMIASAVIAQEGMTLVGGTERAGQQIIGQDAGRLLGMEPLQVKIEDHLEKNIGMADVVIDFTSPEATMAHVEVAFEHGKGIVIGTTALSKEQKLTIGVASQKIPIVCAPNMSIGVNLVFNIIGEVARRLGEDYDVEIMETHHRFKKDAPSGTALRLADIIAEATGRTMGEHGVYGRHGELAERNRGEIAVHAIRTGDVVGDHTVSFGTLGERIEITHKAHSRETFVRGALRAAAYLCGRDNGLFSMQDVLR